MEIQFLCVAIHFILSALQYLKRAQPDIKLKQRK